MIYNGVLRGLVDATEANGYATTLVVLESAIKKLGAMTPMPEGGLVYRGIGGKGMPNQFKKADKYGVRGGTEPGVLSTTTKREVALEYSKSDDSLWSILMEMEVGGIGRPACISCVSQYKG